jgi:hypothetical protein
VWFVLWSRFSSLALASGAVGGGEGRAHWGGGSLCVPFSLLLSLLLIRTFVLVEGGVGERGRRTTMQRDDASSAKVMVCVCVVVVSTYPTPWDAGSNKRIKRECKHSQKENVTPFIPPHLHTRCFSHSRLSPSFYCPCATHETPFDVFFLACVCVCVYVCFPFPDTRNQTQRAKRRLPLTALAMQSRCISCIRV